MASKEEQNSIKRPRLTKEIVPKSVPTIIVPNSPEINKDELSSNDGGFHRETTAKLFYGMYRKYQVVHFPRLLLPSKSLQRNKDDCDHSSSTQTETAATNKAEKSLNWAHLKDLFTSLNEKDRESWCIENDDASEMNEKKKVNNDDKHDIGKESKKKTKEEDYFLTPKVFLDSEYCSNRRASRDQNVRGIHTVRAYCSFLVQHDKEVMEETLARLPLADLSISLLLSAKSSPSSQKPWRYGPCLWFFFGRNHYLCQSNNGKYDDLSNGSDKDKAVSELQGRPEHTDSVCHDGTFHYQLSGTKVWYIRPTHELLKQLKEKAGSNEGEDFSNVNNSEDFTDENLALKVVCNEGDVLVINTRLWWHRTTIPFQPTPSVSYARDFYFSDDKRLSRETSYNNKDGDENENEEVGSSEVADAMTNVDGLYAARDIEENTVIFTENDMPDCELHRSTDNPNCHVVELDDGTNAVVSCRPIKAGEFFTVPESDDEEEEEEEEEEEDIDDEE